MSDINPKYCDLTIFCGGCGLPMKCFGQWPRTDVQKLTSEVVTRYKCDTCRIADPARPNGRSVILSIFEPDLIYDNVAEADGSFTSTLRAA